MLVFLAVVWDCILVFVSRHIRAGGWVFFLYSLCFFWNCLDILYCDLDCVVDYYFFIDYRSPPDPRPDANRTLDLTLTPTFPMYVWENESIFN